MKENYIIVKYYSSKTEDLPSGSNVVDLGNKTYKIIIPDSARNLTAMFGCTIHMKEFAGFEPTNDVGFYSEYGVEYIDMSQFDASKITNMSYMFFWNDTPEIRGARNIVNPNCTSTEGMFMFCGNLKTLDLFNMTIASSDKMFESCSSLTSVILGYSCRILGHCAFSGCSSLSVLYVYRGAVATYVDTFYVKKQGTFLVPTGFITPSDTGKGWECLIGQFNWTKRTGIAYNQIKAKYVVDDDDRLTFPLQLRVLGNTSAVSSMTFGGTSYTPSEFVTVSKPGTYSAVFTVDTAATSYADMFNDCMLYYESGSTKYPVGGITEVQIVNLLAGSKVTDFSRMFKNCRRLTSWLNLNKLCVSSATDLSEMFYGIGHTVEPIIVNGFEQWNVSKVENMSQMFRLSDFPITGLENWNVSAVTNMSYMFEQTGVDKENGYPFPDLSKWNVSSVTDLTGTFQDTILSDLTMFSNWDVSSVTKLVSTFAETTITSTNGLEGWDVSKVTTMSMLFYWCKQLTDLTAIGNWDTSKVTNLSLAFTGCSALEDITPIVGWDVSPETCDWMFGNCTSLKKANLSNWDLSNSQTSRLFKNCTSLEKVYLSEFPLVESEMFSNCTALDDIYIYADVAPGKDTSVDDPFTNIKTYGTLHIKEGATGYRDEPWTILYDVYSWNLQEGNIINIEVGPGGGTFKIEDIPAKSWSITTYPNWITVSNTSGTGDVKFSITVSPNLNETSRSTTIYVNTDTDVFTINVNQSALLIKWYWNPFAYTNNGGGDYSNTLSYNLKPDSIEFNNSDPWFEIISTNIYDDEAFVSIRIPSAGGSLTKNGSVLATLQYGDEEIQVSADVFQYGDNYTVAPSTTVISPEGGSVVVTVESDYTLNDYTSVTGVTAGTYNMERLSSNKIQITFDFGPNYGSPISMTPKLESSLYGTNPIPLTTITQDTFVFNWEIHSNDIYSTESNPENPDVDIVTGYIDYESSVVINDMTFTIEYLDGDEWINSITNQPDSDWKSVRIEAKDNRLGYTRRAKITAHSERYEASREFEVRQIGLQLYVDPSRSTIGYEGGPVTVALEDIMTGWIGPNEFTLVLNGEEVPFTSEFNFRALNVTIDIPENETVEERTFDYSIYVNDEPRSGFTVIQDPFDLQWDFPTTPIYLDNKPSTFKIEFTSAIDIENIIISNVPDWLTFTRSGNTITGTASENFAATPRTATVTFEAEGYNETRTVVITQELAELSKSFNSWLYVYPADINGYVATNVPIVLTCNIWNPGYSWEITTWQGEFETDCKAVVDHFETTDNLATVYLNLFSLVLVWQNAKFNVKIKSGNEVVYETVVDIKWQEVRSYGRVWHQDFGVSTGVVVNTMPREREFVSIIAPATYGRIRGEFYAYDYEDINRTYVTGDLSKEWSLSLFDYELIQAKTDNTTGKIRDCVGTYTMGNSSMNAENTVPITIRQVYAEKYTCIAEERIPYNKTCISFAFGGYMPYKYNIKVPNYVQYIQFEDTQNWECYTAVLYGLEVNDTEEDRIITIPYDVMNGDTIVESGEMRIVQEAQFGVSQDTITVPVEGGEYYIEISAFEDWTIETSGAFFTVDPMSGSGDGGFLIKVLENDTVDMREGIIYVKSGGEVAEIRVIQEAVDPSLYFGKHYIPVRRAGELVRLMLYTNIKWTTEWVTL